MRFMKEMNDFDEILNYSIIRLTKTSDVKVLTVIELLAIIAGMFLVMYFIKKSNLQIKAFRPW